MATVIHQESATIFAFPGKRFKSGGGRQNLDIEADLMPSVYDSCWYHGDAVKDEKASAKPAFALRIVD